MTAAALAAAAAASAVALLLWLRVRAQAERAARAGHEVRGPLAATQLALHGAARRGELAPRLLAALELELRRAALALEDLQRRSARGRRARAATDDDVELDALLRCQVQTWQEVARAHGVALSLRPGAAATVVRADALRIAQATSNVVANAIEHGGGRVEVVTRLVGDRVRVEVSDDGPGLPASVAEIARRPRAGRGRRGRGLAIASGVAARYGGALNAGRSAHGACVAIELPTIEASR